MAELKGRLPTNDVPRPECSGSGGVSLHDGQNMRFVLRRRADNFPVYELNPLAIEVSLAVQRELQSRIEEADCLRHKQVERAQYEADLAQRRYMRCDPENRLVADSLEADWNHKLRALTEANEEYQRRREQDARILTDEQRAIIVSLASNFPRLWRDPATPDRERKRMIRLLLEDVTLNRDQQVIAQIRFKGGAHRTLRLPLP